MGLACSKYVRRAGGAGGLVTTAMMMVSIAFAAGPGCKDPGSSSERDAGGVDTTGAGGARTGTGGARTGTGGALTGTGGATAPKGSGGITGSGGTTSSNTGGTWQDPPVATVTYSATDEIFANPERGFYRVIPILTQRDFSSIRNAGYSLIFADVNLSDYRTRDLDSAFLNAFEAGLAAARKSGVKLVFRFMYNDGPWPVPDPDASEYWIMRHLASAKPVLERNVDVIAVMQLGIIGAWGEWHSSTNGLLDDFATKYRIVDAVLATLPASRMTQIRTPGYKQEGYGTAPLTAAEGFSGSTKARIGHHNDCFLTDASDYGTYDSGKIESQKDYISQEGLFTPIGGETCGVFPPRSECASALAEMERLRWSFVNNDYHPDVIAGWATGGCRPTIERRLGYRFQMSSAVLAPRVRPGGVLPVTVNLTNVGWAPPYNARPVRVVLSGPTRLVTELPGVDPRRFKPGTAASFTARLQLPRNMPAGTYTVSLWLPDAATTLASDSRYAIRLANSGVWDATTGTNTLASINVTDSAPGSIDATATTFVAR